MKKLSTLLVFIFLFSGAVTAQQIGFVDTHDLLVRMDGYQDSVNKLTQMSNIWQHEIEVRNTALDAARVEYDRNVALLTDERRKAQLDKITTDERALRELQSKRFGYNGDYYLEQQRMIKPMQDTILAVARLVAARLNYSIVLEKGKSAVSVLFSRPGLDLTDSVSRALNIPTK